MRKNAQRMNGSATAKKETPKVGVYKIAQPESPQAPEETTEEPTAEPSGQEEPETPTDTTLKAPKEVPAIVAKAKRLTQIIEGLGQLDTAFKDLDSLNLANAPRIKDALTISDGRGGEFSTSNAFLIEKCVEFLKTTVEARTGDLETELKTVEAA